MTWIVQNLPRHGVYLYLLCTFGRESEPLRPVKIGITENVHARLASVQTGHHRRLHALGVFGTPNREIARKLERGFHEMYKSHRLEGERFDIDPIQALSDACKYFRFYYKSGERFAVPGDCNADEMADGIGIPLMERDVKVFRTWREYYAEKSNVTPIRSENRSA
jgi:hypothetical protein